jgi:hypothetical protein
VVSGWSGGGCSGTGGCTVTVSAATTVTATFAVATYPLSVTLAGTGQGSVAGPGIDCGQDCAESVTGGTVVQLTATADQGSVFVGWSGPCSGTGSCSVTVSSGTVVGATFDLASPSSELGIVAGAWGTGAPGVQGFTDEGVATTDFMAWSSTGMDGVFVALGRVDTTAQPAIVAGTGPGVIGTVRILRSDGTQVQNPFRPYGRFDGGVRVTLCEVDGDGIDEIVTSPGPGKSQPVKVWRVSSTSVTLQASLSYDTSGGRNGKGAFVACADLDGDGRAEVITGLDAGGTPDVSVYTIQGNQASLVIRFLAFDSTFRGGVRVATADVDGDGLAELLLATGPGAAGGQVKVVKLNGNRPQTLTSFQPEPASFTAGLFVAGGPRDSVMGGARVITSPAAGTPYVRIFAVSPTAATPLTGFMAGDPAGVDGATVASAP